MGDNRNVGGAAKRAGEGGGDAPAQRPRLTLVPPEVQGVEGAVDPQ